MIWKKLESGTFEKMLEEKLMEAQQKWSRVRTIEEIPAKQLVFCWKRYSEQRPEELLKNPRVIIGTLVHRGIEHYFGQPDNEDAVIKKRIDEYVIVGLPDYMTDDTVYEFKYATSPPSQPKEWDLRQLRIYMWMTGKQKGELVYITPMRIKSFVIDEPMSDDEIKELLRYKWAKYKWECSTCPFRHECKYRKV